MTNARRVWESLGVDLGMFHHFLKRVTVEYILDSGI